MTTQAEKALELSKMLARKEQLETLQRENQAALEEKQEERQTAYLADPAASLTKVDAAIWSLRLNAENLDAALTALGKQIAAAQVYVGGRRW